MSERSMQFTNGNLMIDVDPDRGGSLRAFQLLSGGGDPLDIFQNVDIAGPGSWSYFDMVPYTARIYNGVFPWGGSFFSVAPVKNSQHAIHGPGRQHQWKIAEVWNAGIELLLISAEHRDTFVYPSSCEMTLRYELVDSSLIVRWTIKNVGDQPMPVGGGSHPFVLKRLAGCKDLPVLQFNSTYRYLPRQDTPGEAMPDGRTEKMEGALSFAEGRVPEEGWDHCLYGWNGVATATWKEIGIQLKFEDRDPRQKGYAHLWFPEGRDVWAFEQENAIGNAVNLVGVDTGLDIIAPGETTGFEHAFTVLRV